MVSPRQIALDSSNLHLENVTFTRKWRCDFQRRTIMQISVWKWSHAGKWIVEKREKVPEGGSKGEGSPGRKEGKEKAGTGFLQTHCEYFLSPFRFLPANAEHSQRDSLSEILAT